MPSGDFYAVISNLEKKYNVEEWQYSAIDLWPVIKIELSTIDRNKENGEIKVGSRKSLLMKLISLIRSIVSLFYFILFKRLPSIDVLFSESDTYRTLFNDEYINKYFDSLIEGLKTKNIKLKYLIINDSAKKEIKYKNEDKIIRILKYYDAALILIKIKNKLVSSPRNHLQDLDAFLKEIETLIPGLISPHKFKKGIFKKIEAIHAMKFISKAIIRKSKPTSIVELCYYSTSRYGLNAVAMEKNISVYEMQHGGMGPSHYAYNAMKEKQKVKYNVLPDCIWVWDEASYNLIHQWSSKFNHVKVEKTGNPWLDYSILKDPKEYKFADGSLKLILYTLQFEQLEPFILDAVELSPLEFTWWIRLHPRKTHAYSIVSKQIKERKLEDRVELQKATQYPLPQILNNAYVHISRYSGSIIEAAQLGITNIIVDEMGYNYYRHYVDQKEAVYVEYPVTGTRLVELIGKVKINNRPDRKDHFNIDIMIDRLVKKNKSND